MTRMGRLSGGAISRQTGS